MQTVAYIGPFSFPDGGAAARRILGNAKSIKEAGYEVVIGSGQLPDGKPDEFEGFKIHSIGERTAENLPSFLRNLKYLTIGQKTIQWLDNLKEKPSYIILYSGYSPYFIKLLPWCKKHNVQLIFDAVEWYEASNKIKEWISPYYWNINLAMYYYSVKVKNIIAISGYLQRYYQSKKCNVTLIPPTLDTTYISPKLDVIKADKLTLAYTGNPGHKDLFNNYLEGLIRLDEHGERLVLKVAGLTDIDILNYPSIKKRKITNVPGCIKTLGKVSHKEAINLVKEADFSVLLRRPTRVAAAGFPTKFVESFSVGTPVIANITSDLDRYLKDKETGLICKDHSVESFMESIKRALELDQQELLIMRRSARAVAENSFDYRLYTNKLKEYLNLTQITL